MFYGALVGGQVIISPDDTGKPVSDTAKPEVPAGYELSASFSETEDQIVRVWSLLPVEGTAYEAAIKLASMQAAQLSDDEALEVPALFPEYRVGRAYKKGDRFRYLGELYKVLQNHVSQADWLPDEAASLYAKVLPGQDGNEPSEGYAAWVQPGATNGYSTGDRVVDEGHLWESLVNDNVDKPGTDNGFRWKDLGPYPAEASA